MYPRLPDQHARDRFVHETDRNFSVIAPAGVGKTTAIVDRITHILQQDHESSDPISPRLVLVTYTNKAANEMRLRAYEKLNQREDSAKTLPLLDQVFFGTLHSFCARLLKAYGFHIGIPSDLEICNRTEDLLEVFFSKRTQWSHTLSDTTLKTLERLFPIQQLKGKLLNLSPISPRSLRPITPPPVVAISPILALQGKGNGKKNLLINQSRALRWEQQFKAGLYAPIPTFKGSAKEFCATADSVFGPLERWLENTLLHLLHEWDTDFRTFRLSQRSATYDDLIEHTHRLLSHPEAAHAIRAERLHILLDEAQDTDPLQFDILIEAVRPLHAQGHWCDEQMDPPEGGRFSMVGDPQQSIYGSRSSLATYQAIHHNLCAANAAEPLTFDVTLRCQVQLVNWLNAVMPRVLDNKDNQRQQANYVPMQTPSTATNGQIIRFSLPDVDPESPEEKGRYALYVARWLSEQTLEKLRARSWSEVAILARTNAQLTELAHALEQTHIPFQQLSGKRTQRSNPLMAWTCGVLHVLTNPQDTAELFSLLRHVANIPDEALQGYFRNKTTAHNDILGFIQKLDSLRPILTRELPSVFLRQMMDVLEFPKRLEALSDYSQREYISSWRHLLGLTLAIENTETSPIAWLNHLQEHLQDEWKDSSELRDALQLMTIHKAKGMGFDAVITPFFAHSNRLSPPKYPVILQSPGSAQTEIVLSSNPERTSRNNAMELARLLYVSLTRARNTLIIIERNHQDEPGDSFASLLAESNAPDVGSECFDHALTPLSTDFNRSVSKAQSNIIALNSESDCTAFLQIPKRILPSQLTPQTHTHTPTDEELRLSSTQPNEAIDYGNTWHEMMELTPWNQPETWQDFWAHTSAQSPFQERLKRETESFQTTILTTFPNLSEWRIRTEWPFTIRRNDQEIFEGIIDWIAFDLRQDRFILIDWKTNLHLPNGIEGLREHYKGQLEAYREVIGKLYEKTVDCFLYSTALGAFIEC
jgi:ATP-dependent exoDNAse (exonuclease V) beta subunit